MGFEEALEEMSFKGRTDHGGAGGDDADLAFEEVEEGECCD